MTTVLAAFFSFFRGLLAPKAALALENAALRQQLGVFQRQCKRPTLTRTDRAFWVVLRKLWGNWKRVLFIVKRAPAASSSLSATQRDGKPIDAAVVLK